MIITRKMEVFVSEDDKDLRKEYYGKIYGNRDAAVKIANMAVSHLFMLDNTTPYLSKEDRERLSYLGCLKADGTRGVATKQNAPYVVASEAFKGKVSMNMVSCLTQNVRKMYQDDRKKGMWNRSLRSYKANMPVPFKASAFLDLRFADYVDGEGKGREGCFFTLIGVPFQIRFGRDRSNNRAIVRGVIDGEYKMCTSSIKCEGSKMYLLLCVDMPEKAFEPVKGKRMMARLGVMNPIMCFVEVKARREYDSGTRMFEIGTAEEFNHRRRQIQEAVRRCQTSNRYARGGHGRTRKCQAIERWHDRERDYVDTRLHVYSRRLVDLAVKHKCAEIVLIDQERREEEAKSAHEEGDHLVLRNWSYHGLKEKIEYKAKMYGITVKVA